ncbi:hypothetical protein U9M48_039053 [Paspalum notatum var. saurae]|uniref:Integrase catalytic domain-containing protein n=1 Tax=Paspalum notatum var. saurae TaxID=547442 RepID=A0AAQ3UIU6_PASNO
MALLDFGSTHNFIHDEAARAARLPIQPRPGMRVTVANGDHVAAGVMCHQGGVRVFDIDLYALPLGCFDKILGVHTLGPILWDFAKHIMCLVRDGQQVTWTGLNTTPAAPMACVMDGHPDPHMAALLEEFAILFEAPQGLPPARHLSHRIRLEPGVGAVAKDELERHCDEMLCLGVIRPSSSAFFSPALLIKKDGAWRFCVDYRALNTKTIKDEFPIPVVEELLDKLRGAMFFTKLDMRFGYHQTAFRTHQGLFKFLLMSFGLTNAPTTFQALMNDVLMPFPRRFMLVFFDDILIYSSSWSEHLRHVRLVLQTLQAHQLRLKGSKCEFGLSEVAYQGHVISNDESPGRPRLALTGFYPRVAWLLGALAVPLTALFKRDGFTWSEAAASGFEALQRAITTAPVLQLPDFDRDFVVECDASGPGFGAVLHQGTGVMAFFSKPIAPRHAKLAAYERELIGLVLAVRHWRPYLWGRRFIFALPFRSSPSHNSPTSVGQQVLSFDFTVEYKAGSANVVANALSRRDELSAQNMAISSPHFSLFDDLCRETEDPGELQSLWDAVARGEKSAPWTVSDGLVLFGGRLFIPAFSPLLQEVLRMAHGMGHEGVQKTLHRLRADFHIVNDKRTVQEFVRACETCQRNKIEHLQPAGLLQPLEVPLAVWTDIAMDFIEALRRVHGKTVILTVVDRFSKYAHFILLSHPYTAALVARAFFNDIVRLHGIPASIVCDRDPVFTSAFWKELFHLVGAKLNLTSAFHPPVRRAVGGHEPHHRHVSPLPHR